MDAQASERPTASTRRLRTAIRDSELALIGLAVLIGLGGGAVVSAIGWLAQAAHETFFGIAPGARLSGVPALPTRWVLLLPALGGVLLGASFLLVGIRKRAPVDPIEANALHGGHLSLRDSVLVVVQNLISNGFGASVGLEAGYTQIAGALASRLGIGFDLRRNDLRLLVGCGAAAAIAAAFDAPMTGAFYAFELIVGTYSIASLAPIMAAALCATAVSHLAGNHAGFIDLAHTDLHIGAGDYPLGVMLGVACAGFGIAIMQSVAAVEGLARRWHLPIWLRPSLGGLLVGALALVSPQVLSSGHGALHLDLEISPTVATLAVLILFKSIASIFSLGSGFRGGLFFASLLLGALFGNLFANVVALVGLQAAPIVYAVVGMSALAVTVIGGPLTMTFLALEVSGDFPVMALVLVAVLAASVTARKSFGYTFATWRFHLRGESIRSAHDVGWIRSLTVGQLMRRDIVTVPDTTTIEELRRDYPLGSTQRVVAVDATGRYAGIVVVPEAHADEFDAAAGATSIAALLRFAQEFLIPGMNAKEAAEIFDRTKSEALAVVDGVESRRVTGLLTESHTLRRYSEELDRKRGELAGES